MCKYGTLQGNTLKISTKVERTLPDVVARHIAEGKPFTSYNLTGEPARSGQITSYLDGEALRMLRAHNEVFYQGMGIQYVVSSYSTPIGWVFRGADGKDTWVLVQGKMTRITSGHMSYLRQIAQASCLPVMEVSNERGS